MAYKSGHITVPPNLWIPSSEPLSISKKVQWEHLQSYLDTTLSQSSPCRPPSWLDSVERSVLFTLIAYKRFELELLHLPPEWSDTASGKSWLHFPNNEVATGHPSLTTSVQAPRVPPNSAASFRPSSQRAQNIEEGIGDALAKLNSSRSRHAVDGDNDLGQFAPLSPTFGPRKGHIPVGTHERRPASVPINVTIASPVPGPPPPRSAIPPLGKKPLECFTIDPERRLIWEVAWREIESDLEAYAPRFEHLYGELDDRDNDHLWAELVRLKHEKEKVDETIRSGGSNVFRARGRDGVPDMVRWSW